MGSLPSGQIEFPRVRFVADALCPFGSQWKRPDGPISGRRCFVSVWQRLTHSVCVCVCVWWAPEMAQLTSDLHQSDGRMLLCVCVSRCCLRVGCVHTQPQISLFQNKRRALQQRTSHLNEFSSNFKSTHVRSISWWKNFVEIRLISDKNSNLCKWGETWEKKRRKSRAGQGEMEWRGRQNRIRFVSVRQQMTLLIGSSSGKSADAPVTRNRPQKWKDQQHQLQQPHKRDASGSFCCWFC